ncbi:putative S1B family peptidase [Gemmatirosa kalamazoonensis]|uniref:Putative S1B family peptidase n=1 Tax=Gemmatirosa kalamazoonensis TaxID=861299 RepID=W0RN84_9BACT|nr:trypsin-like peptidase domain-containing protein [Gemmatirosa kalamazoonensis]AHG90908.1 putative S1B family peptidase [Gemmatirosa kalamazoonensis]
MRTVRPPAALAMLVVVGCQGGAPSDSAAQTLPAPSSSSSQRLPEPSASTTVPASRRTAIVTAVERVAPAVVTVQTETVERTPIDPFDYFFGRGGSGEQRRAGLGTGFIVRDDGVIVTNAHVITGATQVMVAMRDGKRLTARVVGSDETNDLAVLKVDAKGLPVAPLGTSDNLLIGEWAIAIGNPFGFVLGNSEPSVTAGVISATGRNLVGQVEGGGLYLDMIQTDAAINPGNSGGPLVNADGEVIGVNSSIYSPSGGSVGLGFAIPINRARRVAEDLLAHGVVRRPWVGVSLSAPRSATSALDVVAADAVVRAVTPGRPPRSPASRPATCSCASATASCATRSTGRPRCSICGSVRTCR